MSGPGSEYEVVSPEGAAFRIAAKPRETLVDLNDATIVELWDDRFYGNEIFAVVREELKARYPGVTFVEHSVFGNIHGSDEDAKMAHLATFLESHGCSAVISAVGA